MSRDTGNIVPLVAASRMTGPGQGKVTKLLKVKEPGGKLRDLAVRPCTSQKDQHQAWHGQLCL